MNFQGIGAQGNYARAGQAVANDAIKSFAAARRNSPNFGKMAQEASNIRTREKEAMMDMQAQVTVDAINAKNAVRNNKTKLDAEMGLRNAKRKAGVLAAGGKFFGQAATFMGDKRKKRSVGEGDDFFDNAIEKVRSRTAQRTAQFEAFSGGNTNSSSSPSSSNSSQSPSNAGNASPDPVSGNNGYGTDMDYMKSLTDQGYSPEKAAAIVGNIRYETGDFQHLEEIAPNAYGTKGLGILQWTDTSNSGGRRTNFTNWAKGQNLDPGTFQANAGYLAHEMSGADGDHWSGGGGLEGFKNTGTLNDATSHFMTNYLRPAAATANLGERQRRAADTLSRWNQQNGL